MCIHALKAKNPVKGLWSRGWQLTDSTAESLPSVDPAAFGFEERMSYIRKYGNHCMSLIFLNPMEISV
jgi:hypothetical protein